MAYIDAGQGPLFTGSHELAEMLGDPNGNNTYAAPSPDPSDNGKEVEILDELCDPCEDDSFGSRSTGCRCLTSSLRASGMAPADLTMPPELTKPREVAINGYISWIDGYVWKQATNFAGQGFQVRVLGQADQAKAEGKSLREWVDEQTRTYLIELGLELPRAGSHAAT